MNNEYPEYKREKLTRFDKFVMTLAGIGCLAFSMYVAYAVCRWCS